MSDTKNKFEQLKAFFLGLEASDTKAVEEVKEEEVALMEEDVAKEEVQEEAPAPVYATAEQLSAIKDEIDGKLNEMADMLSKFAEMVSTTEKNTVPQEMSEDVKEEVEELAEQAPEPVKHDPEGLTKEPLKFRIGAGGKKTTQDVVFESLRQSGLWN